MPKISVSSIIDKMYDLKQQRQKAEDDYESLRVQLMKAFDSIAAPMLKSNDHKAVLTKRLNIVYDVQKVEDSTLDDNVKKAIVVKTVKVTDYYGLVSLLKEHGIKPSQFKQFIDVEREVDKFAVEQLFDKGVIKIEDLSGCYHADVIKAITIS